MRKKIRLMIILLILIGLTVAVTSLFFLIKNKQILFNPMFVSREKQIVGVDISHYQGEVDFNKLAGQGIKFAYIKATEGSAYTDEHFADNWEKANSSALSSGVLIGAYHFFSFGSGGGVQAENYASVVGDLKGKLIPVVDVELYGEYLNQPPDNNSVVTELKSYLRALEIRYGVKPMIYAEVDVYKRYLEGNFSGYPFWIRSVFYPIDWEFHHDWTLWQYTDRGELDGYYGEDKYIDLNVLKDGKKLEDLVVR
ncbi:glycosyl hydrolase family 25 [Candidatus Saccharibacteria bacterium]|nr:glycosyl hydrolase family 25 [Candidatus Saccharibacteria bacterium]